MALLKHKDPKIYLKLSEKSNSDDEEEEEDFEQAKEESKVDVDGASKNEKQIVVTDPKDEDASKNEAEKYKEEETVDGIHQKNS